jgi:hypothetical protein
MKHLLRRRLRHYREGWLMLRQGWNDPVAAAYMLSAESATPEGRER